MKAKLNFGILLISLFCVSLVSAGDVFEIGNSYDLLELREPIGDVQNTITSVEMPNFLVGGIINTNQGSTAFNQYLRFFNSADPISNSPAVNFTENQGINDGFVGDYLYIQDSDNPTNQSTAFLEYELEFESGLESTVSAGKLPDLMDIEITFFNVDYTIVDNWVDTSANEVTLFMWSSEVKEYLQEGETKNYFINGIPYAVEVTAITNNPITTILKINGQTTTPLSEGQTFVLNDGTVIGVQNIILNTGGVDIVEIFLDVGKLEFKDSEYIDGNFDQTVMVDGMPITEGLVKIDAAELSSATKLEISTIRYRLSADALNGDDVGVEPGQGVRGYLDTPEGMIHPTWDIRYEGLDNVQTSIIKLDPSGDDEYKLVFENKQGLVYNVPFATNEGGTFKYGNDDRDFVFEEGRYNSSARTAADQQPTIGHLDYFVLSDVDEFNNYDNRAISHVMRYGNYDAQNKELKFEDMATGDTKLVTYVTTSPANGTLGSGDLNVGGTTYKVYVANVTSGIPSLIFDLDADGNVNMEEVRITINGGGIIDLGKHELSTGGSWNTTLGSNAGVWSNTGNAIPEGKFELNLTTLASDFDEGGPITLNSPGNEWISFIVDDRPFNEIGIASTNMSSNGGIHALLESVENNDYYSGMTDYGALVTLYDASLSNTPETLTIEYPLSQRGVNVLIVEGDIVNTSLPDLLISDYSVSPSFIEPGDLVTVNLTLMNAGTEPVIGNFNWVYDFDYGANLNSLVLNSGDSLNLSFTHTYGEAGDYTFYFEVDPTQVIEELNENNNVLFLNIFVDGTPDLEPFLISKKKDPNNRNNILFNYRIKNHGDLYVDNFDYDIAYGDGTGAGGFITERINAGSYYDFNLSHEYNVAGKYDVDFKVDAFNLITELNETNNLVSASVWIPCDKVVPGMKTRCLPKKR
mgnify:CR=1 FL=1